METENAFLWIRAMRVMVSESPSVWLTLDSIPEDRVSVNRPFSFESQGIRGTDVHTFGPERGGPAPETFDASGARDSACAWQMKKLTCAYADRLPSFAS